MRKPFIITCQGVSVLFLLSVLISSPAVCQSAREVDRYHNQDQMTAIMKDLQAKNSGILKINNLGSSPGKRQILLYEIGTEINNDKKLNPAILVVADMEGNNPLGTEAAVYLVESITGNKEHYENLTWFILPSGNPDAAERFFTKPLYKDTRNDLAVNDDMDDQTDEDGYNDLDGNGLITMMRVKSPDGEWTPAISDPRLMKKADPSKGEKGIYKLYTEGIDDDNDGKYNEDVPGGTNVGLNFPHLFKFFVPENGLFPGSAPEAYGLMRFVFNHPEIAMTFAFGSSNFCLFPPKGGRAGSVDMEKISIPEDIAKSIGADPSKTYSMKEIMDLVKPIVPAGIELDENVIANFLGLGAVVNPQNEDLVFYKKLSEDYAEYLKKTGFAGEKFDPEDGKDGSFELWSYYHLGLPVFSMDLWSIPKPKEEKTSASGLTPESIETMSKGENTGDPKEKAILAFFDKAPVNSCFVQWTKFNHPSLGEVEIGGFIPYSDNTPPPAMVDSLIRAQVPWIFKLTEQLPLLKISDTKITPKGGGLYQLEAWISNEKYLPYPTAMGKKNKQPAPVVCTLEGNGLTFLSGKKRMVIESIPGLKKSKLTWLIQAEKGTGLTLNLNSKSAGNDTKQIKIEE